MRDVGDRDNRRGQFRLALPKELVAPSVSFVVPGKFSIDGASIVNMSRSGLFLRTEKILSPGDDIRVSFELNDFGLIEGVGSVKWARKNLSSPLEPAGIGVEFSRFFNDTNVIFHAFLGQQLQTLRLKDIMRANFEGVQADVTIDAAIQFLQRSGRSSCTVIDRDNNVVGVLAAHTMVSTIGLRDFAKTMVHELMTPVVRKMSPQEAVLTASELIPDDFVDVFPITEQGKLIGTVGLREFLPYWSDLVKLQEAHISFSYDRQANMVMHDIRSPLSLVKSANAMMLGMNPDVSGFVAGGFAEVVDENCGLVIRLAEDMLDAHNIRIGRLGLNPQGLDLKAFLQRKIASTKIEAKKRSIEINLVSPDTVPLVIVDEVRMEQIANNLFSNALKFTSNNSTVIIQLVEEGDFIRLEVQNANNGVTGAEGVANYGIGLAIVKRLVEAHHGQFHFRSALRTGTTVTVRLPRAR